jgi:hypothetical protein
MARARGRSPQAAPADFDGFRSLGAPDPILFPQPYLTLCFRDAPAMPAASHDLSRRGFA